MVPLPQMVDALDHLGAGKQKHSNAILFRRIPLTLSDGHLALGVLLHLGRRGLAALLLRQLLASTLRPLAVFQPRQPRMASRWLRLRLRALDRAAVLPQHRLRLLAPQESFKLEEQWSLLSLEQLHCSK